MAQRTYKDIEKEANRLFGNKPSKEKFEWRKAQQRESGLKTEAKKRGGYAGVYDRNKKLVSAAATGVGFLLGGPAGAALARGGIAGLDRPGQSGIGFDVKRGLKGGLEGYMAGQGLNLASSGASALKGLFTGGQTALKALPTPGAAIETVGQRAGAAIAPPPVASVGAAGGGVPAFVPSAAGRAASSQIAGMAGGMGAGAAGGAASGLNAAAGNAAQAAGGFRSLLTNPQVISGALGGISNVMGQQANRAVQEQQLAQQQSQFQQEFDVGEAERKRQQEQANRLAAMFIPRASA